MPKEGSVPDRELDGKGEVAPLLALDLFGKIAAIWGLSIAEQSLILRISEAAFLRLRKGTHASAEVLRRISYIVKVYKALNILLGSQEAADTWIKRPNSAEPFYGSSALSWLLDGPEDRLAFLHEYLRARLGS